MPSPPDVLGVLWFVSSCGMASLACSTELQKYTTVHYSVRDSLWLFWSEQNRTFNLWPQILSDSLRNLATLPTEDDGYGSHGLLANVQGPSALGGMLMSRKNALDWIEGTVV